MKKLLIFFAAFFFLSGCVTPYEAPFLNEDFKDLLVVEGTITDGETIIKLSRSYPIYPPDDAEGEYYGSKPVYGASVWVEGENGERFDAEDHFTGEYIASGVTFSDDVRYRLRIAVDGEEYESDYRLPQHTPSIESVDFHLKNGNAGPLEVRFNVNAEEDDSRYYLWRYEENWEIHAAERALQYFGHPNFPGVRFSYLEFFNSFINEDGFSDYGNNIGGVVPMDFPGGESPYYYCWKNNKSKELLLAATDLLTENALQDHVLYEIDLSDDRLSSLYNTKISLYSIGEDAYFYYLNQKRNTDETGSIFSPIPAEMRGNIVNTTSPNVPVIGFVDVAVLSLQDIYLEDYDLYQPRYNPYTIYSGDMDYVSSQMKGYLAALQEIPIDELEPTVVAQYMSTFYPIIANLAYNVPSGAPYEMGHYTYNVKVTEEDCIDCRRLGGNKNRPSWWPNDHY